MVKKESEEQKVGDNEPRREMERIRKRQSKRKRNEICTYSTLSE